MAIFLLGILVSSSFAVSEGDPTAEANETANETSGVPGIEGDTVSDHTPVPGAVATSSAQGIWRFSLAGTEIILALNQSEDSLFGLAKSEGSDPWNGAVAGSLSSNQIHLSLAALQATGLASIYMSGTIENESIVGSYVRSESSGKAAKGELTATLINPDTSAYTPAAAAAIDQPSIAPPEPMNVTQAVNSTQAEAQPSAPSRSSKFKDVTELAKGIDPNILPRMAPL